MSWFCIYQHEGIIPFKKVTWCEQGHDSCVKCDESCPYRIKPAHFEDDYRENEYLDDDERISR